MAAPAPWVRGVQEGDVVRLAEADFLLSRGDAAVEYLEHDIA